MDTFPVLVYRVSYPPDAVNPVGVYRTARMAFRTMSDYMASARFMRSSSHYQIIRTDWLTETEIKELGVSFAVPDPGLKSA